MTDTADDDVGAADADAAAGADTAPAEPNAPPKRRWGVATAERFRARIRKNKVLNTTWRVTVALGGALFLLLGLVMLVTPGPGWLAIVLGFAILASEFVWARTALRRARRAARAAKQKALDPKVRRRNQILLVLVLLLVAAGVTLYISQFGLMLPWHPEILRNLP